MPSITLTDVVAHTLADAGVMNNNNAALRSVINGGIDNANVSPSAGLAVTKLALPGGTTNFLRADGTWATPGAGGDVVYTTFTNNVAISSTTQSGANTIVTAASFNADGGTYWLDFYAPRVAPYNQGRQMLFHVWEGGADLGQMGIINVTVSGANATVEMPILITHRFTPSAGARVYSVRAWQTGGSGSGAVDGSNGTGFIRIYR